MNSKTTAVDWRLLQRRATVLVKYTGSFPRGKRLDDAAGKEKDVRER